MYVERGHVTFESISGLPYRMVEVWQNGCADTLTAGDYSITKNISR